MTRPKPAQPSAVDELAAALADILTGPMLDRVRIGELAAKPIAQALAVFVRREIKAALNANPTTGDAG